MSTLTPHAIQTVPHEVHRLAIPVDASFDDFRARYEAAVPRLDAERFKALMAEGAGWDAVLRATAENAPHDFIVYWSFDDGLLRLAGDRWRCVEYLMGNHTI